MTESKNIENLSPIPESSLLGKHIERLKSLILKHINLDEVEKAELRSGQIPEQIQQQAPNFSTDTIAARALLTLLSGPAATEMLEEYLENQPGLAGLINAKRLLKDPEAIAFLKELEQDRKEANAEFAEIRKKYKAPATDQTQAQEDKDEHSHEESALAESAAGAAEIISGTIQQAQKTPFEDILNITHGVRKSILADLRMGPPKPGGGSATKEDDDDEIDAVKFFKK